jgi:hypothetical protein
VKFKPPRPPDWVMNMLNQFDIVRTFAGKYCDSVKQQLARDNFYGTNPLREDAHFTSSVFDSNRPDAADISVDGIYELPVQKKPAPKINIEPQPFSPSRQRVLSAQISSSA